MNSSHTASTTRLLSSAFAQAPSAAILFHADENLTIAWRNTAHEKLSQSLGVDVRGQGLFEAFPPSEDADGAAAMQAIHTAVDQMMNSRTSVDIGPYRYDLQDDQGAFVEHHWRMQMSPVIVDDTVVAFLQVAQDATRDVLDKLLADSLRRAAASTAAVSHFIYDPETDHFDRTAAVDEIFGFAPGEAGDLAAPFFARVHPEDLPGVQEEVARVFAAPPGDIAAFDYRVPRPEGGERFVRIRAEVAIDPEDRRPKLVGTFVDLTDVENDRRQLKRELALRAALVDEANHRINNSLSIALAMLRMGKQSIQREAETNPDVATEALSALEARIGAISGTHGLMQLDGQQTDVSLHALLSGLLRQTRTMAGLPEDDLRLTLTGPDTPLDSDVATRLSLITNELLTNAVKYGLSSVGTADIELSADTSAEEPLIQVRNRIADNDADDAMPSTKLGSLLVKQLAQDLGTTVASDVRDTTYTTWFRLPATSVHEA